MERIIIKLKDLSKKRFLLELLAQFDFIEFRSSSSEKKKQEEKEEKESMPYDFFQSFGLMKGCEVNADQLRKAAWRINP
jgi:hypothetical protein